MYMYYLAIWLEYMYICVDIGGTDGAWVKPMGHGPMGHGPHGPSICWWRGSLGDERGAVSFENRDVYS